MITHSSRRRFLQQLGLFVGGVAATPALASLIPPSVVGGDKYLANPDSGIGPMPTWPERPAGAKYMGDFRAPQLEKVRIAFIGVGSRGGNHAYQCSIIPGAEVVAICDLKPENTARTAKRITAKGAPKPAEYSGGDQEYHKMLAEVKPDAVIVSTRWQDHAQHAIDSMKAGAHAFVEVPMAVTIKELWDIVDTSEQTQRHCMMMENVNYGRDELLYLNMVRQGVIGDLLHGEAAYIHELRGGMKNPSAWRPYHFIHRNGNLYSTHGLGPVAQYMNLARGEDMFARLVSYSSPAIGRAQYAEKNLPANHKLRQTDFECGDMNTSIIKTSLGRTIMVQWDETSPRPYSRHNLIQGTLGTLTGFPTRVAGEKIGDGNYHKWIQGGGMNAIYEKYEHPLWKRVGEIATKMGGHGGMDYLMLYRMVECLRQGEPLDQNVYEGALWTAVSDLSELSIRAGGAPQLFPDFTRGDWKTTHPLGIIS